MTDIDEMKQIISKIESLAKSSYSYEKMSLEELSSELKNALHNQNIIQESIDEFEKRGMNNDFIKYARMVCANSSERQIAMIQENYFQRIDKMLQSK